MSKIIKRPELLEESNRDIDLIDFSESRSSLELILKKSSLPIITAIIGAYGSGKTVLINTYLDGEEGVLPIQFDTWKHMNKKDLWEGFILQSIKSVDPDAYNDTLRAVDGNGTKALKLIVSFKGFFASTAIGVMVAALAPSTSNNFAITPMLVFISSWLLLVAIEHNQKV